MSLELYFHPFASFCQKVLVALYENDVAFEPHVVDLGDEASSAAFKRIWPIGRFPVLRDQARARTIPESSMIIEYLERHYPGRTALVPADGGEAVPRAVPEVSHAAAPRASCTTRLGLRCSVEMSGEETNADPPALRLDLGSQAFKQDPFPTLARLRQTGPVIRARLPLFGTVWLATTYEAVNDPLCDHRRFGLTTDWSLAESAVQELLRHFSVRADLQASVRPRGHCILGSTDPPRPDDLRLPRRRQQRSRLALRCLFTRFPGLTLAIPRSRVRFSRRPGMRGLVALPVRLG